MAFGIEISTTDGVLDLADLRTVSVILRETVFTTTGTIYFPSTVNPADCFGISFPNDGDYPTRVTVYNDRVEWTDPYNPASTNHDIWVLRYK